MYCLDGMENCWGIWLKENNFPKSVTKDQIDEQDHNSYGLLKIELVWYWNSTGTIKLYCKKIQKPSSPLLHIRVRTYLKVKTFTSFLPSPNLGPHKYHKKVFRKVCIFFCLTPVSPVPCSCIHPVLDIPDNTKYCGNVYFLSNIWNYFIITNKFFCKNKCLFMSNIEMSYPLLFSENKTHQLQNYVHAGTNLTE